MKSLFLKIFLSFWLAQALFVVLAVLVTLALRPRSSTWEALRTTVLNDSVNAYEDGGDRKLREYLDDPMIGPADYPIFPLDAPWYTDPWASPPEVHQKRQQKRLQRLLKQNGQ